MLFHEIPYLFKSAIGTHGDCDQSKDLVAFKKKYTFDLAFAPTNHYMLGGQFWMKCNL